jgi:ABC-type antimicrobial peptide transport system permease subunit
MLLYRKPSWPNRSGSEIGREPLPGLASRSPRLVWRTAWDRYNELLREPLPAAVAGMLYAGFWVSLLLSLLDFGFYLAVTARRRSLGFAVLQALGWNASHIWALLAAEQAVLILPALLVGIALGAALAYVILPFLALVGGETLSMPVSSLLGLLIILLAGFGGLLSGTAWWLRRLRVNQVLRLGEE